MLVGRLGLFVNFECVVDLSGGEVGFVFELGGSDGDNLIELFVFGGFIHSGLGVVADVVHFGAGDGDDEIG